MKKVVFIIVLFSFACGSMQVKPVKPDMEQFCIKKEYDPVRFRNISNRQGVRGRDYKKIRAAWYTCANHLKQTNAQNMQIAERNKPDSFFDNAKDFLSGMTAGGILIALAVAL